MSGNPNSGKSTAAQHLSETHGFIVCRPSDLIRGFAITNNLLLLERRDYIRAHIDMVEEYGEDYVVNSILETPGDRVCVDGERIPRHIEKLHSVGAKVLAFWCPLEIRYGRSLVRGEVRDKNSLQAFAEDEAREYCSSTPPYTSVMTVMQMADYHIDASQPIDRMLASVDACVEPLLAAA